MVAQLECQREVLKIYESIGGGGAGPNPNPIENILGMTRVKSQIAELEAVIGDSEEILKDNEDFVVLPHDILEASYRSHIGIVLDWLGPPPIDKKRINAKDPTRLQNTLLQAALIEGHSDLMSILLQFGADVDPKNSFDDTPLQCSVDKTNLEHASRLLLGRFDFV